MRRPPACKIQAEIQCPQCGKPIPTLYQCSDEGDASVEAVEIKCTNAGCGYSYTSRGSYGKKP